VEFSTQHIVKNLHKVQMCHGTYALGRGAHTPGRQVVVATKFSAVASNTFIVISKEIHPQFWLLKF
jgi:hypothetical protein